MAVGLPVGGFETLDVRVRGEEASCTSRLTTGSVAETDCSNQVSETFDLSRAESFPSSHSLTENRG